MGRGVVHPLLSSALRRAYLIYSQPRPGQPLVRAARRAAPRQPAGDRILVIGAGLSGLSATLLLESLGHQVILVEARDRCGGRVWTLRRPFADGLHAEAGAGRISDAHTKAIDYVRRFGLSLEAFYPEAGRVPSHRDGIRSEMDASLFTSNQLHRFFSYSMPRHAEQLKRRGRWERLGNSIREPRWLTIRGGMDRLPSMMAKAVAGNIRYQTAVTSLRQLEDGVEATVLHDGRETILHADHVVCAIPVTTLRRIAFTPMLPGPKREAMEEVTYEAATRTFLQVRDRIWMSDGSSGFAATDEWGEIWHASHLQPGPRGVLVSYLRGKRALAMDGWDEAGIGRRAAAGLEAVIPGVERLVERTVRVAWHRDLWAGGAKAELDTAEAPVPSNLLARAEGRIHFAGEHLCSPDSTGWMDGALESGERAALEVHEACRAPERVTVARGD